MPVILIPIHFDRDVVLRQPQPSCQYSVVLRTFVTEDFMTGVPVTINDQVPAEVFHKIVTAIMEVPAVSRVLYDLTPKPPGTTEWEWNHNTRSFDQFKKRYQISSLLINQNRLNNFHWYYHHTHGLWLELCSRAYLATFRMLVWKQRQLIMTDSIERKRKSELEISLWTIDENWW